MSVWWCWACHAAGKLTGDACSRLLSASLAAMLLSRAAFASFLEDEGTKRLLVYSDGKELGAVSVIVRCVLDGRRSLLKTWQHHARQLCKPLHPQHTVLGVTHTLHGCPCANRAEHQAAAEAEEKDGVLCEDLPSKAGQ